MPQTTACIKLENLTDSLAEPAAPVRLLTPALVTKEDICLQARAMLLRTIASSASRVPLASSCMCPSSVFLPSLQVGSKSHCSYTCHKNVKKCSQAALVSSPSLQGCKVTLKSQVDRVYSSYFFASSYLFFAAAAASAVAFSKKLVVSMPRSLDNARDLKKRSVRLPLSHLTYCCCSLDFTVALEGWSRDLHLAYNRQPFPLWQDPP